MKIRSLPDRDKSHKRVKDVADLHALLWYTKPYDEIREQRQEYVSSDDIQAVENAVTGDNSSVFEDAGTLLQIDPNTIQASIFLRGENPAVYGGRESDNSSTVHRRHSGRIFHANPTY